MMLRKLTNSVGFSILLRSCSTIPQSIEYESVLNENDPAFTSKPTSHSFLVIHPKIRWGAKAESPKSETSDYQLEEAVSLVKTIPGFSVVESAIVGTDYNTKKKQIWGQGRLEALIELKASTRVSAVMLNIDILTPLQQTELFNIFQVPVYDRYNIVLLIFKHFAKTNLAHLQIQLAEIPYIRHRLKYLDINKGESDILQVKDAVNSLTKTGPDRLEVLRLREQSLKKKIRQSIISAREEIDVVKHRQEKLHANKALTVAVIGYTNVGKTSFIKKVTGASSLHPEDRLFATLDTSLHHAVLPSKNNIYLADTIGFISHLPTQLFGSFSATLMHAMSADLLVHLFDISHPNAADQRKNVIKTLQEMEFSEKLMKNMIQVGNKCDKIDFVNNREMLLEKGIIFETDQIISSTTGYGIDNLVKHIDSSVMSINNSWIRRFKLKPNSKVITYLHENGFVLNKPSLSECGLYLIYDVAMNQNQIDKMKSKVNTLVKQ